MKILYSENFDKSQGYSGVGLGNFDGLHIGHMALINTLLAECESDGLRSILYTFEQNTGNVLRKSLVKPVITPLIKKIEILTHTQLNALYLEKFTNEFSKMEPIEFIQKILLDKLKMKLAVIGFDYRFGYKGTGDADLMIQCGEQYGFKVIVIPPIRLRRKIVSSTEVRRLIANGEMRKAFEFLGRHFSIIGKVSVCRQIGRTIGFPTANIKLEDELLIPPLGVYITKTKVDGKWYRSITNIGKNPTIQELENPIMETNIFDFACDIYGKEIEVVFLEKIRGEVKFISQEDLREQIKKDVEFAKKYFI